VTASVARFTTVQEALASNELKSSAIDARFFHTLTSFTTSPDGSPVQSNLIGQKIQTLQEKHEVPVWAFAEVGGGGRAGGREGRRYDWRGSGAIKKGGKSIKMS